VIRKYITGENKDARFDLTALTNGVLAGLVTVTASSDCVEPWVAVLCGFIGGTTYSVACLVMNKLRIDDPVDAFQIHGCCGFMGCITLAFFKMEDGIFYGGKSYIDEDGVKVLAGWELLGIQIFGCLCIVVWSGGLSGLFFFITNRLGLLRLCEMDEIIGGDLHYFGPIVFDGKLNQYDLPLAVEN
jgi:Amt family ammonium transporter